MKTSTGPRCITGALFISACFCRILSAQEQEPQPTRITVSGDVEMIFAARHGAINEASFWTPGGLPPASPLRDHDTFIFPRLSVQFHAEETSWRTLVEIGNTPLAFDSADTRLQSDRMGEITATRIDLRQAWVELYSTVRFGAQEFRWDPAGRGHPLFLEPSAAESPWEELQDSTVPPFPSFGTNTVPQTRRDARHPVGLTARVSDLTLFALLLAEGGAPSNDEAVYGGSFAPAFGDFHPSAILTLFSDGRDRSVGTVGLAASFEPGSFFLSAEGYFQFGTAGRIDTDGDGRVDARLRAQGSALRLIARYAGDAWIQAAFVRVSGDKDGADNEEGRFLSYENNDATLIVEGNEFGLDIDSNYTSVQVSAGADVPLLGKTFQPRVLVALFSLLEKMPLPPDPAFDVSGRSSDLGTEVDLTLDLPWSSALTFSAGGAFLIDAQMLEEFTSDRASFASLFTLGMRLKF